MALAMTVLRYAVFSLVTLAALSAFGVMAVQRRQLNPFGRPARVIRRFTDPLLKPIERRLLTSGGNPQSAPWWMLAGAVVGGILVISLVEFASRQAGIAMLAAQSGPRGALRLLVLWTLGLLNIALIVRVLGSWVNAGRWTTWMRPFYWLTEWFLAPLRRVLPTVGPFDISPIVAWLLIDWVVRPALLSFI